MITGYPSKEMICIKGADLPISVDHAVCKLLQKLNRKSMSSLVKRQQISYFLMWFYPTDFQKDLVDITIGTFSLELFINWQEDKLFNILPANKEISGCLTKLSSLCQYELELLLIKNSQTLPIMPHWCI